jgi:hypothetical protein
MINDAATLTSAVLESSRHGIGVDRLDLSDSAARLWRSTMNLPPLAAPHTARRT